MGWEERFLLFLQESVRNPVLDRVMLPVFVSGFSGGKSDFKKSGSQDSAL